MVFSRPAFVSVIVLTLVLSTKYFPRQRMDMAGWRLSENVVYVGYDSWTAEQLDEEYQSIIKARALRPYYEARGVEIDLNTPQTCYAVDQDDGVALVVDCPIWEP